jgi:hypothetical protein
METGRRAGPKHPACKATQVKGCIPIGFLIANILQDTSRHYAAFSIYDIMISATPLAMFSGGVVALAIAAAAVSIRVRTPCRSSKNG